MKRALWTADISCRNGVVITWGHDCAKPASMRRGLLGQFARPTSSSRHTREARPSVPESRRERRQNVVLRELLDEMIQLSRHLSNHAPTLPGGELTYARERLEWLPGEVLRPGPPGEPPRPPPSDP